MTARHCRPTRQMAAVMRRLAEEDGNLPDITTLPIEEARRQFEGTNRRWNEPLPDLDRVEPLMIPGGARSRPARLFMPEGATGLVVFVHGGGWVFGSLESHARAMALLAVESRAAVLGIDYRLAPEHPFPAGLEDVVAAVSWALEGGAGGGPAAVAGDSAGANLALAAMLRLRDDGRPLPKGAALFYGVYDADFRTESHRLLGTGAFGLSTAKMRWYWDRYAPEAGQRNALAAPLHADLSGLPPLYLNAAGLDPLRDDSIRLVDRLKSTSGAEFSFSNFDGVVHGFMQMSSALDDAQTATSDAGAFLRSVLDRP